MALSRALRPLEKTPAVAIVLSLVLLALVCYVDFLTGDYSLIVFYLIPVSLVSWSASRFTGIIFCVLSLMGRLVADFATKPLLPFSRMHCWNLFTEFIFLVIMSLLVALLRKLWPRE